MPTVSISDLPAELLVRITEHLDFGDVKVLSRINTQFHEFLVPTVFKRLSANNRENDAARIEQVATKYGRHVETLCFYCFLEPRWKEESKQSESNDLNSDENNRSEYQENSVSQSADGGTNSSKQEDEESDSAVQDDNDAAMRDTDDLKDDEVEALHKDIGQDGIEPKNPRKHLGFPQIAQDLLAGKYLPALQTLVITFRPLENFNTIDGDWSAIFDIGTGDSIYINETVETDEQRIAAEEYYQWRANLNQLFKCLCSNTSIRKLEIHEFIPKTASTFYEAEWPVFLAKLYDVQIHLWGGDNGACWHSSTVDGYLDFIACLPELFFQHLRSAKRLTFAAEARSAVGCAGSKHTPIPLQPAALPEIRNLTIENCYVDQALRSFLASKAQQLESLHLLQCFSAADPDDPPSATSFITWAELFRSIRNTNPILKEMDVSNGVIELEGYGRGQERERMETAVLEEVASSGGKRKLFGYAFPSDKYGDLWQDKEANMRSFQNGVDQREYDALMELIEKNGEETTAAAVTS